MEKNPETIISELGLELPSAPKPMGVYKPVLISGNLLYVSGTGPIKSDGSLIKGRVGDNLTPEEGKSAAAAGRSCNAGNNQGQYRRSEQDRPDSENLRDGKQRSGI